MQQQLWFQIHFVFVVSIFQIDICFLANWKVLCLERCCQEFWTFEGYIEICLMFPKNCLSFLIIKSWHVQQINQHIPIEKICGFNRHRRKKESAWCKFYVADFSRGLSIIHNWNFIRKYLYFPDLNVCWKIQKNSTKHTKLKYYLEGVRGK